MEPLCSPLHAAGEGPGERPPRATRSARRAKGYTVGAMLRRFAALGLLAGCLLSTQAAQAFCGFYVSGADAKLFNNATQVVLMREGTRTALSMQNNYQGPPEKFAMVVPVPVVLQKDNVKILKNEVFAKVDQLSAPRLVEYWEQDPCYLPPPTEAAPG